MYRADLRAALDGGERLEDVGSAVLGAVAFVHSPAWYYQQFLDSMALVRARGKPTYFITL